MELYSENKNYKLYHGNMLDMLEVIEPNSIGAVITDPPYGLTSITKRVGGKNSAEIQYGKDGSFQRLLKGFMGKEWDGSGIEYNIEAWRKCYEVLKPGGYLLAFGGTRTFHRIACSIEDAGFEIRDTIMWLYGSGFPKSHNVGLDIDKLNGQPDRGHRIAVANRNHPDGTLEPNGEKLEPYKTRTEEAKQWEGWGTALKPSYEPIIVARKPLDGTVARNCLKYGVGGINIDECRVGNEETKARVSGKTSRTFQSEAITTAGGKGIDRIGRFPANTLLTYNDSTFEEVCGGFLNTKGGSACRYFYRAKASKKDRDEGLESFDIKGAKELLNREENSDGASWNGKYSSGNAYAGAGCPKKNTHPTVKPTELMQYLIRLVVPKGETVLDPFNGSGSTGKAVMYENKERNKDYKYIGIELTEEYLPISKARIEFVCNLSEEQLKDMQTTIFDFIGENNE